MFALKNTPYKKFSIDKTVLARYTNAMKKSEKSPEMESALDSLTGAMFGRSRTDSIRQDVCVTCGQDAGLFRDGLSRREYTISGMCQACQDEVFGGEDD